MSLYVPESENYLPTIMFYEKKSLCYSKIGENGKSPIKFRKKIFSKNHISATIRPTEMVLYVPESENYLPTIMFYEKNHFVILKDEKMANFQKNTFLILFQGL